MHADSRKPRSNRDVAQLVAHYVRDVGVGRSSRLIPTKKRQAVHLFAVFVFRWFRVFSAQRKSTGDVFLFHSILYLCIMNMLEQLARLVLPKEILDNFDIVKIETDESDIDSMSLTIHLDERMNAYLQKSEDYESKGFMDAVRITDFPIRDHKVILVLRRRRWRNKETGETFVDRISVTESGTRYSKEFAAFLKETYGHIPDDLPYA